MQITPIRTENEELYSIVMEINNRLDQITRKFNELEAINENGKDVESSVSTELQEQKSVFIALSAKFVKLGLMNLTNAPNGSLLEDESDGVLKYKDHSGTVTSLT